MGSLYHLNADDEPEHPDYFKDPELRKKYGTRGVIHTWANSRPASLPPGAQGRRLTASLLASLPAPHLRVASSAAR